MSLRSDVVAGERGVRVRRVSDVWETCRGARYTYCERYEGLLKECAACNAARQQQEKMASRVLDCWTIEMRRRENSRDSGDIRTDKDTLEIVESRNLQISSATRLILYHNPVAA